MNLVLVGLNHKTAPVEVRECLAPPAEELPARLQAALGLPGVREAYLVSTCNRVEVLVACEDAPATARELTRWLADGTGLSEEQVAQALYTHLDEDAVRHLFRVAASLDSLVVGEPQILGQLKEAYRTAAGAGSCRAVLNRLMHKTFTVAKRVRTETNIGGSAVSVSYAAVELAKKIFDDLHGLKALLVGAGEMAELAAEHLLAGGVQSVSVANRTLERAMELAERLGGRGGAHSLADLGRVLGGVDIVITSTGATEPVVTKAMAKKAMKERRGRPIFFIDIAVPRDVEPKVAEIDGMFVYDIDDLNQVVDQNWQSRMSEAQEAEEIVATEVVKFGRWLGSLDVQPTIASLTRKAEEMRAAEVERTVRDLGLDDSQAEALESMTRALVKKLLHDPIMFLKEPAHGKSDASQREQVALIRRAFGLGEDDNG